ncbi:uncharacterized protein LOC125821793 [Solanum verrucosum]|uniref:uncharacterized protein LOC125821793 n=1 Tax=Solanum verrucosum TaxID=315347 RepID=UPI0020D15DED|nr:uncharacterized protein LOC125821793 [Solanum verrucosum]
MEKPNPIPKIMQPLHKLSSPFPQRLKKKNKDEKFKKFLSVFKTLSINLPLVEALLEMSGYAKSLKKLVTKKRSLDFETIEVSHSCSAIMTKELIKKREDPGAFTIPCSIDAEIPIILGRPFLATERALVDVESGELKFRVNEDKVTFNVCKSMKHPSDIHMVSTVDISDEAVTSVSHLTCMSEPLEVVFANYDEFKIQGYEEVKLFFEGLRRHIKVIGWTIAGIVDIPPGICTYKIQLDSDCKPSVEHHWRLNPPMQEVVKKEIIKWLDAGVIYPIADSKWVSLVQCVPKKGGITVVPNEKGELVSMRPVTRWRVCMDYQKLNSWTKKDHFPMSFMDQMLDRHSKRGLYCFLDGYSGYNQISIALED